MPVQAQELYEALVMSSVSGGGLDHAALRALLLALQTPELGGSLRRGIQAFMVQVGSHRCSHALQMDRCQGCGAAAGLRVCAGCEAVKYCGNECKDRCWPLHKAVCKFIRRELP